MAQVLVLVDHVEGEIKKSTFELLTAARELGEPAAVVVGAPGTVGKLADGLREYGAATVYVAEAEETVSGESRLAERRQDVVVEPRRAVEERGPRRVAGGVVVEAVLGLHLDGWQRARTVRTVDHRHRDLRPRDEPLGQHRVGVGEAAHHRGGQLLGARDDLRPPGGPALVGLEHQRQAEPVHHRRQHRPRTELAERRVRQRDPVRGVQAGPGELRLRRRLVPRASARRRGRAHERHAE